MNDSIQPTTIYTEFSSCIDWYTDEQMQAVRLENARLRSALRMVVARVNRPPSFGMGRDVRDIALAALTKEPA